MGLLALGTPFTWEEGKKFADHIREHGITQFLNIWDRLKDREGDNLLWGDEVCGSMSCRHQISHWRFTQSLSVISCPQIEYMVVAFDDKEKNAKISLCQEQVLATLEKVVTELRRADPENA